MINVKIESGLVSHWKNLSLSEMKYHWRGYGLCTKNYVLTVSTEAS